METKQKRRQNPDADNIMKEAGEWFLGIESDSLSPGEMDDFGDWVEENDTNREKLDLTASVWNAMDGLKDNPLVVRTVEKSRAKERAATKGSWLDRVFPNFSGFRYAAVVATLLLIMAGIWLTRSNSLPSETYETAIGEQKTVYLSDDSTVYIDTNSEVSVYFTEDFRYIELSRGKVFFSVAYDPTRPFIVMAGHVAARAVGTEFEVYKKNGGKITIAVSNGRVQVNQVAEKHLSNIKKGLPVPSVQPTSSQKLLAMRSETSILSGKVLEPGQEIVVDDKKAEYVLTSYDSSNVAPWREGRLNFQSKALSEVIDELNRYLTNEIIIGDNDLKDLNVNVYFKLKNRKDFVRTLENAFPITSRTLSNGKVVLLRRQ